MTIEQELDDAVRKLYKVSDVYKQHRQRVAGLAGAYFSAAAEAAAPKGKKVHKRYSTAKATGRIRAPKGRGTVTATYSPGNLARSINVLKFRRAKSKVFIGAKLARSAKGKFSGRRADGYYMHFTEHGTPHYSGSRWFSSVWSRSRPRVLQIMIQEFTRIGRILEQKFQQ